MVNQETSDHRRQLAARVLVAATAVLVDQTYAVSIKTSVTPWLTVDECCSGYVAMLRGRARVDGHCENTSRNLRASISRSIVAG